ncbi:MAG: mechanosensitive ion channel family protein [bacterium]
MGIDLSAPARTIQALIDGFLASLPRLALALVIVSVFWVAGRSVRRLARRIARRHDEQRTLEIVVGRVAQTVIVILGALIALTAAFPSFTPANLVSTLGIGGVALGFAFKDIFQNFVAGLLILITRPFRVGDQIIFQQFEGTVEEIETRATFIKTYDGRRVIIPNADLYTTAVTVNTAFARRRMQYDVGIGYGDDIGRAREVILGVLRDEPSVSQEPAADVIVTAFEASTVTLRARWWSDSRMSDVLLAQSAVLTQIKQRLTEAGVDLPFPTRQILFHDQTEEGDGDRRRQREGWPAGSGPAPAPAGIARAIATSTPPAERPGADDEQRSEHG